RNPPHIHKQPERAGEHHQWPAGDHADRARQDWQHQLREDAERVRYQRAIGVSVLLPVPGAGDHRDHRLHPTAGFTAWPGVDGDPRGRDRGQGDGHQRAQCQAAGVLARSDLRRRLGRDVRGVSGLRVAGIVHAERIDHCARDDRPRWPRPHPGSLSRLSVAIDLPRGVAPHSRAGPDIPLRPCRHRCRSAADDAVRAGDGTDHAVSAEGSVARARAWHQPGQPGRDAEGVMSELVLRISGVNKRFGGVQALAVVGMEIRRGEIYGLIAPNGAGKTTFFNVITGLYAPDSGTFELDGQPYEPSQVHLVATAGIARTYQHSRLFPDMTARENVMVGRHVRTRATALGAILRTRRTVEEERGIKARSIELLEYVGIRKYADFQARTLAYGDQRRLEIARALATEPKLLALDEPAAGMNATEKLALRLLLEAICRDRITILLIEHDVKLVMGLCDKVTVLDYGKMIAVGQHGG